MLDMSRMREVTRRPGRAARARRARVPAPRRRPRDAGARAGDGARLHLRGRRRRADPRRRLRLSRAPLRLGGRQPRGGRDRHRRRGDPNARAATRTPTCSGRSGAAARNFGVVTRFTFRLHEVGPTVHGGLIAWPFERADEILRAYRTLTAAAPRELAVWLILLRLRPRRSCPRRGTASGSAPWPSATAATCERADEALAPIRALGDPVVDLLRRAAVHPRCSRTSTTGSRRATTTTGRPSTWRSSSDELLATLRERRAVPDPRRRARDPAHRRRAQRARRGRRGGRQPRRAVRDRRQRRVGAGRARTRTRSGLGPGGGSASGPSRRARSYVNFQTADEGEDRVRGRVRREPRAPARGQAPLRPGQPLARQPQPAVVSALSPRARRCAGRGAAHGSGDDQQRDRAAEGRADADEVALQQAARRLQHRRHRVDLRRRSGSSRAAG